MKNKTVLITAIFILLFTVLGCSYINPLGGSETSKSENSQTSDTQDDNKSIVDKTIDEVLVEKTGVPECDELSDYFSKITKSKDENYIGRATREFIINRYREAIRKSIEENKNNPEQMAKYCKEYLVKLKTYQAEQESNKESK